MAKADRFQLEPTKMVLWLLCCSRLVGLDLRADLSSEAIGELVPRFTQWSKPRMDSLTEDG